MSIENEAITRNQDHSCEIKPGKRGPLILKRGSSTKFTFTYEVEWVASKTEWASRWDIYLNTGDGQIHWFSIINSIIIIIFLTGKFSNSQFTYSV